MISVIIYGRNDTHGYNLHKRAAIFFNVLGELLTHPDDEIVFADCNTPEGLPTFPEVLQDVLTPAARARIRVIRIPAPLFREKFPQSKLPAIESFSRNVALRRTRSENPWVLSTNTDLVFIPKREGVTLTDLVAPLEPKQYLLPRFNIPEWLWESLDRTRAADCMRTISDWSMRFHLKEICTHNNDIGFDSCGDFQLAPRTAFFDIQGFDETMRLGWHVDANMARRLYLKLGNPKTLMEDLEGYHLNHNLQVNLLHAHENETNDFLRFYEKCHKAELPDQKDTWGLPGIDLEEIQLPSRRFTVFQKALGSALPKPAALPALSDSSNKSFNGNLFYPLERVVPYLANFLATLESGTKVAYVGVHGELFAALHKFLETSGRSTHLLASRELSRFCPQAERLGEPVPFDVLEQRADLFLVDFYFGTLIPPSARTDLKAVLSEKNIQTYAQAFLLGIKDLVAKESRRLERGLYPRRFVFVGHQGTEFEGHLASMFRFIMGPFNDHVHYGVVRKPTDNSVGKSLAAASVISAAPESTAEPALRQAPVWTPVPSEKKIGFNVIGYLTSNTGLSVAARNTVSILKSLGYPVALLDVDMGLDRNMKDTALAAELWNPEKPLPHAVNIFHMNPFELGLLLRNNHQAIRMGDRMNICVPFWELSRIPGNWVPVLEAMDMVLAPTHFVENAVSASLSKTAVRYYPQAVELPTRIQSDRKRWGLPENALVFGFSFDFSSVFERKNPMAVIEAFLKSFSGRTDVILFVKMNHADALPLYSKMASTMEEMVKQHANLRFMRESIPYHDVIALMACWDVYVSLHRAEGLGLGLMECMSMGKAVMATGWSGNMDFMHDGNSILVNYKLVGVDPKSMYNFCLNGETDHVWADPDVTDAALWMRRVAEDAEWRKRLGKQAQEDMRARRAEVARGEVFRQVEEHHKLWCYRREIRENAIGPRGKNGWKVLFQNRPSAGSMPGGDTVVMDRFREQLEQRGVFVDVIHDDTADPSRYDLVHLFNLVLPKTIEPLARRAQAAGTPYVVQAFQENQSFYLGRSVALFRLLLAYMQKNQDKAMLPRYLELMKLAESVPSDTSTFAAQNARAVICSSREEQDYVRSLHPSAQAMVCMYGAEISQIGVGPELFEKAFGLRDFVLCVGRLETRKNQLALLAALEDDDIPIVFADGGVCYSPDYANVCRAFRRKGRTVYTGRMSKEMLVSAYRAAKAHVLPSWYELPGLVTLEAALYGCNVAASPHGGIRDYLGDSCLYFEPEDLQGMRRAALRAMESPKTESAAQAARQFTWEKSGENIYRLYESILSGVPERKSVTAENVLARG